MLEKKEFKCIVDNKIFDNYDDYKEHYDVIIKEKYNQEQLINILNNSYLKNYLKIISLKKKIEKADLANAEELIKIIKLKKEFDLEMVVHDSNNFQLYSVILKKNFNKRNEVNSAQETINKKEIIEIEQKIEKSILKYQ